MKKEIQFCVYVVYVIVWFRVSETYTNCLKLATGKLQYGYTCIQSSECQTEYCINAACSCPDVSLLDEETGLCARKSGHIIARNEECGYIVSTGDIPFGALRQWNITGEPETYVTLVILEFSNCNNNYVDVIEDSRIKSRTQCTTGDFTDKYHASKSNHITVNYRGTTAGDKGFRAIYFIRNNSAVLTEPTGYIASPGYPTDYGGYREYTLLIRAKQGQLIRLSPVGSTSLGNAYVHVYDGQYTNMTVLNNLTDQCTLKYYTSTSNYMLVKFTLSFFSQGFSGSYKIFAAAYGDSCNVFETCLQGLACHGGVCLTYEETICKDTVIDYNKITIIVGAVGWFIAVIAVTTVIVMCLRHHTKSATYRGDNEVSNVTEQRDNDNGTLTHKTDQDYLECVNNKELEDTHSVHSTSTAQTTNIIAVSTTNLLDSNR